MRAKLLKQLRGGESKSNSNLVSRYSTFLVCVVLATLLWLLLELGKDYTNQITVPITYSRYPKIKVITNKPLNQIKLTVRSKGSNLIRKKIVGLEKPLSLNLSQLNYKNAASGYILLAKYKESLSKQLGNDIQLLEISPDTIHFEFSEKASKKLPIVLNNNISYEKQYMQSGKITIQPDSVIVTGPQQVIDTLAYIITKPINNKGLSTTKTLNVALQKINDHLIFDKQQVKVTVPVEQFTEGEVKVPIVLQGRYNVRLFPKQVKLVYVVPLSIYDKIKPYDFKVLANFTNENNYTLSQVPLNVIQQPNYIKILRVEPEKAEYIIQK